MTLPAREETVPATDMPERIYARKCGGNCVIGFSTPSLDYNIEYVRADLVQDTREQAVRECAEIADAQFRQRRDAANEYFEKGDQGSAIICRDEATACLNVGNAILALLPTPLSLSQVSAKK